MKKKKEATTTTIDTTTQAAVMMTGFLSRVNWESEGVWVEQIEKKRERDREIGREWNVLKIYKYKIVNIGFSKNVKLPHTTSVLLKSMSNYL